MNRGRQIQETTTMDTYATCAICYESKRVAVTVTCPGCATLFCKECFKMNLLSGTEDTITCANVSCKIQWTAAFVCKKFSLRFYNETWKNHLSSIRFINIKSTFPLAMNFVNEELAFREVEKLLPGLQDELENLRRVLNLNKSNVNDLKDFIMVQKKKSKELKRELKRELKELKTTLEYLKDQGEQISVEIDLVKDQIRNIKLVRIDPSLLVIKKKKTYTTRCPADGCNAYVNEDGVCDICKTVMCLKCNTLKTDDTHECNSHDIETLRLIKKDSKQCPKCSAWIQRISGCDHMWCTSIINGDMCKTAFSYNTGRLLRKEENTNPHYFHYLAEQRKNGFDVEEEIDHVGFEGQRVRCYQASDVAKVLRECGINRSTIANMLQCVAHIEEIVLPELEEKLSPNINEHMDLTVKFILKEISEKKFHSELKRQNKQKEKTQDVYDILHMFKSTITDMFRKMLDRSSFIQNCKIVMQMEEICLYVDKELSIIAHRLNVKTVPTIKDWTYFPTRNNKYIPTRNATIPYESIHEIDM